MYFPFTTSVLSLVLLSGVARGNDGIILVKVVPFEASVKGACTGEFQQELKSQFSGWVATAARTQSGSEVSLTKNSATLEIAWNDEEPLHRRGLRKLSRQEKQLDSPVERDLTCPKCACATCCQANTYCYQVCGLCCNLCGSSSATTAGTTSTITSTNSTGVRGLLVTMDPDDGAAFERVVSERVQVEARKWVAENDNSGCMGNPDKLTTFVTYWTAMN